MITPFNRRQFHFSWAIGSFCLLLLAGCTTTSVSYHPLKPSAYPAYKGQVLLLSSEKGKENVPGAEELGTVSVMTASPWMTHKGSMKLWQQEAARHGGNAVRPCREGAGQIGFRTYTYSDAKVYRIDPIDQPGIQHYLAGPYEPYTLGE